MHSNKNNTVLKEKLNLRSVEQNQSPNHIYIQIQSPFNLKNVENKLKNEIIFNKYF